MKRLTVLMFVGSLCCPVAAWAQVNPFNDFFGGFSILTTAGDAAGGSRVTPIGWQASVSQKMLTLAQASITSGKAWSIVK